MSQLSSPSETASGFRIAGYVVEVKDCRGPSGAAPARVYYARTKEQRKARSPMGMEMYRIWA